MLKYLRSNRKKIITFFVIYLIIDLFVIGAFFVSGLNLPKDINAYEKFVKTSEKFMTNLTNPLGTLGGIITSGEEFGSFLNISFYLLIVFIILIIFYSIKHGKKHEYDGTEHGSSEWSKDGEEYDKQPDGSEILNKKDGFIIGRKHYIGTDLKKVKINKNILVVGRFWCW
jgi:hypothetical protein